MTPSTLPKYTLGPRHRRAGFGQRRQRRAPILFPEEKSLPASLQILEHDIQAMDYWLNDCPMSDPAGQNAVVFALKRVIRPGLAVRVGLEGERAIAMLGPERVDLGRVVGRWLSRALTGGQMEALHVLVRLPKTALPNRSIN